MSFAGSELSAESQTTATLAPRRSFCRICRHRHGGHVRSHHPRESVGTHMHGWAGSELLRIVDRLM